jgi:transposase
VVDPEDRADLLTRNHFRDYNRRPGGVVPLYRQLVQPASHPSRTRWALTRRVRGGLASQAVATSLGYPPTRGRRDQIAKSPANRGNSNAAHLARLLHLGQITEVTVPSLAQEGARDLVRAREDCRGDLMGARHRLSKLLLRQGIVYYGGQAWTGKHELWLRAQRLDNPALALTYEAALDAMVACVHRRDRLDEAITTMAVDSEFTPVVARLGCVRGISTLTAFGLAVEIGDWHRLTGRSIGAYLGLVPCEYTSGGHPGAGRGYQDRQPACPPSAGRGGLASPRPVPSQPRSAPPLGRRHPSRA